MSRPTASTPMPKKQRRVVSLDHEAWMGLAANCIGREVPQLTLGHRDGAWKAFIKRCTPQNVFALLQAHAHALEAMVDLAAHLEQLPCICPFRPEPGSPAAIFALTAGEAHLETCPQFLRGHPAFQRFDATALEGPLPRPLSIQPREAAAVPTVPAPVPAPAEADAPASAAAAPGEAKAPEAASLPPAP